MPAASDHNLPRPRRLSVLIGRLYLRLGGWTLLNDPPSGLKKAVLVAAPHTSNWDFPITVAASWAANYRLQWLGKMSLFKPPLGWLLKALGGVSIDRSKSMGTVAQLARRYTEAERMIIAVPASGTRSARPRWKSGFYHIAREAQVPVLCAYVDYTKKQIAYGPCFVPTSDVSADMDRVRAFFDGVEGRYPSKHSAIRLAEEDA